MTSPRCALVAACCSLFLFSLSACDASITPAGDAGARDAGPSRGDANVGDGDSGPALDAPIATDAWSAPFAIVTPSDGADVFESVVVETEGARSQPVRFFVGDETDPRCVVDTAPHRCLIHLDATTPGSTVAISARTESGAEDTVSVRRLAEIEETCTGEATACVAAWIAAGTAAGYEGVTYENRDDEHAVANTADMPGITYVRAPGEERGSFRWGVVGPTAEEDRIVISNASVSPHDGMSGWCSVGRYESWDGQGFRDISATYRRSKLLLHPEHRDVGHEDFYPFQSAAIFASQGSSYSEMEEVRKFLFSLAAMRSDVRARLHETGLLVPTLQMLHRRSRAGSDAGYLMPAAHPSAFADSTNEIAMIERAHALTASALPPLATLAIVEEDFTALHSLVTTPESIARVWEADETTHRVVLDAGDSYDADGDTLTYHWRVLRGDASAVTMSALEPDGSRMEIELARHEAQTYVLDDGRERTSSLLVIALFVHDGRHFSAPAYFTSFTERAQRWAPDSNNYD
jgi:hypothetical protein